MDWDRIEEKAMRLAGKGYFGVSIACFLYILWDGNWYIRAAAIIATASFIAYSILDPDPPEMAEDDDRDF